MLEFSGKHALMAVCLESYMNLGITTGAPYGNDYEVTLPGPPDTIPACGIEDKGRTEFRC